MKIRSTYELEDYIANEYAWRRKELTNIKNIALASRKSNRNLLIKSAFLILYAHWEGFIKNISIAYCVYLNTKGYKYKDVKINFKVFCILNKFKNVFPHKRFSSYLQIVNTLSHDMDEKLFIDAEKYIDTESNLKSDVLQDITLKLGIDYSPYELKQNLIDESFVGVRNAIAHGEFRKIDKNDFLVLYNEITDLIDLYKNHILNSVYEKNFLDN